MTRDNLGFILGMQVWPHQKDITVINLINGIKKRKHMNTLIQKNHLIKCIIRL